MAGRSTENMYIHGTEPSEQERLAALNHLTNEAFVQFLGISPQMRILEVGSGLGILAAKVASAAEGVHVCGLERAPEQIAAAIKTPNVTYVQGDAHQLDFPDGSFDLVYARYLLEHVSDPLKVLSEMRRVVCSGGRVAACENDVTLVRLDPPCPTFEEVWQAFQQYQKSLGGDALIGRKLYRLFRSAGFSQIELSVQPEVYWYSSQGFPCWIQNLIGVIESGQHGLVNSSLCKREQIQKAIVELKELSEEKEASSCFMWNRAIAIR